jgi:hypothetical protein
LFRGAAPPRGGGGDQAAKLALDNL